MDWNEIRGTVTATAFAASSGYDSTLTHSLRAFRHSGVPASGADEGIKSEANDCCSRGDSND